jgi:hypothetical protein
LFLVDADHDAQSEDDWNGYWEKYWLILRRFITNPITYRRVGMLHSNQPPRVPIEFKREKGLKYDTELDQVAFLKKVKALFDSIPEVEVTIV